MRLISLLGKGQKSTSGEYGYESVIYCDPVSGDAVETPYVGEAIVRLYRDTITELDILGTTGSMWHLLYRHACVDVESSPKVAASLLQQFAEWEHRIERAQKATSLTPLEKTLSEFLRIPTRCHYIPAGSTRAEADEIEALLQTVVQPGEELALDITHGLRFQPMVIERCLRKVCNAKEARLRRFLYGALELPQAETGFRPILDLTGVLQ